MKFMIQMNVKQGPYQMTGWSQDDVKRMINYMHDLNKDLKAKGQFVAAEGLVAPDHNASSTSSEMPSFIASGAWMSHTNFCCHSAAVTRIANSRRFRDNALR